MIYLCPPVQPSFTCAILPPEHPCLRLPERGSNYTLPQILPVDTIIEENDVHNSLTVITSLRGSFPDACLDLIERYLCILVASPCDPNSHGLPMQLCEQDCAAYKVLEEEGACDSTIELIRDFAGSLGNTDLLKGISVFEMFDCANVTTYYFFESKAYAETCTGLLSKHSRGEQILLP